MIESIWENKGHQVRSVWVPLNNYEGLSPIVQVYGVCFTKEGKVLVIKNEAWNLPGGTPEKDETPEETLIREVYEEATVKISNLQLLGAFDVFFPNNPNKEKGDHYYQLRYLALIDEIEESKADPASGEFVERKFINPDEFCDYIKWGPLSKPLIEAALTEYRGTVGSN